MKNFTFLRKSKITNFHSVDLQIDFLIDSGAESTFINIPVWNDIQNLRPKLPSSKISSKRATSQGSSLIN